LDTPIGGDVTAPAKSAILILNNPREIAGSEVAKTVKESQKPRYISVEPMLSLIN